ncbi:hypothetical protein MLD38_022811 [Melastoma candidum]|uniref:Uncharacterized protein n=1 Tax=Melastoma candidum TaxID=119954 RepID=A0ACB9QL33_9MYRT|nr:hypothetical protein MLD38_022811 [Melastoma candidum]
MDTTLTSCSVSRPYFANPKFPKPSFRTASFRSKQFRVKSLLNDSTSRRTLSSGWNTSGNEALSSVTPNVPWLPRFEELDTTNMLLRQRIIFLGAQVFGV